MSFPYLNQTISESLVPCQIPMPGGLRSRRYLRTLRVKIGPHHVYDAISRFDWFWGSSPCLHQEVYNYIDSCHTSIDFHTTSTHRNHDHTRKVNLPGCCAGTPGELLLLPLSSRTVPSSLRDRAKPPIAYLKPCVNNMKSNTDSPAMPPLRNRDLQPARHRRRHRTPAR